MIEWLVLIAIIGGIILFAYYVYRMDTKDRGL